MTEADLIADAADLMRRIPMTRITLQMLAASPRDANYDSAASFREGEGLGLRPWFVRLLHFSQLERRRDAQVCTTDGCDAPVSP